METNDTIKVGFDIRVVTVKVSNLIETVSRPNYKKLVSYQSILASIKDVGILQPISIYPTGEAGK